MQEKIHIKPLNIDDINDKYICWVNDPLITEYLEIGKRRLTYRDLVKYVEDSQKNGRYNYAIITKESKNYIGNCSIFKIESDSQKFEIGWLIGEKEFWGGHYSSMIIFDLFKIGFIEMKLEKCIGYIDKTHIKARMANRFAGFKEIKTFLVKKDNKIITTIMLEITKKDWLIHAKSLHLKFPKFYDAL
tara:strand:- start:192 stop:755 length:564 start_codon:yes stop_codon:yes gene_type:complete